MRIESYDRLVAAIAERPARLGGTRLVAVDGRSGSGKSMTARRLAIATANAGLSVEVVNADDVLRGWEHPLATADRLRKWILDPISRGESASYRPFDWISMCTSSDRIVIDPPEVLIMDGVGSSRSNFDPLLTYSVFIYADVKVVFSRVLDRDGLDVRDHLLRWQSEEDEYFVNDDPRSRADVVIDGEVAISEERFSVLAEAVDRPSTV